MWLTERDVWMSTCLSPSTDTNCSPTVSPPSVSATSCHWQTKWTVSMRRCRSRWCLVTGMLQRVGLMPSCRLPFARWRVYLSIFLYMLKFTQYWVVLLSALLWIFSLNKASIGYVQWQHTVGSDEGESWSETNGMPLWQASIFLLIKSTRGYRKEVQSGAAG